MQPNKLSYRLLPKKAEKIKIKNRKNSRTKPSSNCYHKSEASDMESKLHLNPVKYLTNASLLSIPLSVLDHTLVKKIAWRPPKTCKPIIQSHILAP